MSSEEIGYDRQTGRWHIYLPEDEGRPRIEADDTETLLAFLEEHVQHEIDSRRRRQKLHQWKELKQGDS